MAKIRRIALNTNTSKDVPINYYPTGGNVEGRVRIRLGRTDSGVVYPVRTLHIREDQKNNRVVLNHEKNHFDSMNFFEVLDSDNTIMNYMLRSGFYSSVYRNDLDLLYEEGIGINEGATQYLAIHDFLADNESIKENELSSINSFTHSSETFVMGAVANAIGIEKFRKIYMTSDIKGLESSIDEFMGSGYFTSLRDNLDTIANSKCSLNKTVDDIPDIKQAKELIAKLQDKTEKMGYDIWVNSEMSKLKGYANELFGRSHNIEDYITNICEEEKKPEHNATNSIYVTKKLFKNRKIIRANIREGLNSHYLNCNNIPKEKKATNLSVLKILQEKYIIDDISIDDIRNTTFSMSNVPQAGNILFMNINGNMQLYNENSSQLEATDINTQEDLNKSQVEFKDIVNEKFSMSYPDSNFKPQILNFGEQQNLFAFYDKKVGLNVFNLNPESKRFTQIKVNQMESLHGAANRGEQNNDSRETSAIPKITLLHNEQRTIMAK